MANRIRLVLADYHTLFVDAIVPRLDECFEVVSRCHTGDDFMFALQAPADVLLLEPDMPGRSWLELIPEVHRAQPALKVLIVTMHRDRQLLDKAMQLGASGFIPKEDGFEDLVEAIREVFSGRLYTSRSVPPRTNQVGPGARHPGMHRLTPREQEIMELIGQGLLNREIAERIGLSPHTVNAHRKNIRRRMGITTKAGLMQIATLMSVGAS